MSAEVHEGEEAQEAVVVGVEVAIVKGLVLHVPQVVNKLLALIVAAQDGGGSGGGHETNAVAQLAEAAGTKDLVALGQRAVLAVLVEELIDALRVEEVLNLLAILALPLTVGTTPLVVERNIHRYAPRVVAEIVVAIAGRRLWSSVLLLTRTAGEAEARHLGAVVLALVAIEARLLVDALVQERTALTGTLDPVIGTSVVAPLGPYLVEGGNMVAGVGEAIAKAVGGEGDELAFRVDEVLLLRALLLAAAKTAKATKACRTGFGRIFLGLYAVEDVLCLGLVVNAGIVAPAVGGEDESGDEVELAVAGGTCSILRAVGLTTPGEIALSPTLLMLHVLLGPAPQTVEDVLLAKLHGDHQAIGHALGAGIVVLDVADVAHGVAHLEVDLVRTTEDIVEDLLQLGVNGSRSITHLHKNITVLTGLKSAACEGCQSLCGDGAHQHPHSKNSFHVGLVIQLCVQRYKRSEHGWSFGRFRSFSICRTNIKIHAQEPINCGK